MVSNSYLQNAAKQIKWRTDIKDKFISVPENEIEEANDHLMVQHLKSHGFKIQICIPDALNENKVFDPDIKNKFKKSEIKEKEINGIKESDKFRSGDIIYSVKSLFKEYLVLIKPDGKEINITYEMLKRNLGFKIWVKI